MKENSLGCMPHAGSIVDCVLHKASLTACSIFLQSILEYLTGELALPGNHCNRGLSMNIDMEANQGDDDEQRQNGKFSE